MQSHDDPGGPDFYGSSVVSLGMNEVAAVYFAAALTRSEATDLPFLKVLAARLVETHQDLLGSLDFARGVT